MRAKRGRTNIQTGVYPKNSFQFNTVFSEFTSLIGKNTGSVTSFLGVARLESADGKRKIRCLHMEAYEKHANRTLKKICSEVEKKFNLNRILIVHALGDFSPGEPVVMVLVSSTRRTESFDALREAVERYKKEPALFKQEIYADRSSKWIQ